MLTLDRIIAALPARPDVEALLQGFVPPPRFAGKRFENYRPDPRYPSQEEALRHLRSATADMRENSGGGLLQRVRAAFSRRREGQGIYLDGGFGVGKTHLLSAFWRAAPAPKSYLSFDELVYLIGLLGIGEVRRAFQGQRLVAIDEWELDDPGNLKLALAFLRGALEDGIQLVVTSNTIPVELGEGRFSQKDFEAEIEELASAFEVLRIRGEDFRHRRFEADPGRQYFLGDEALRSLTRTAGERALHEHSEALLAGLERVHPIRYGSLVEQIDMLLVEGIAPVERLSDALRWVHFVDTLYDSAVPLAASSRVPLGDLFPTAFVTGPYGKKVSRCLSRMEEMLGERQVRE